MLIFVATIFIALVIMIYPIRHLTKVRLAFVLSILLCFIVGLYYYVGSWTVWRQSVQEQEKRIALQKVWETFQSPAEVIDKLKMKLQEQPNRAQGWYLLGRLYMNQGQWEEAYKAFSVAHQLKPKSEKITLNYAESAWQKEQQFNSKIRVLLEQILQKHPDYPDALAMLAMDAYQQNHWEQAIQYWQQLLRQLPVDSSAAIQIRKAIAQAQRQLSRDR